MSFETEAELSITIPDSELRQARQQIESSIGSTEVGMTDGGSPSAQATGGGGGRERRRRRREFRWARDNHSNLEDMVALLGDLETGGGGGSGLLDALGGVAGEAGGGLVGMLPQVLGTGLGAAVGSAVGDAISGEDLSVEEPDWTPIDVDHPDEDYGVEDPSPLEVAEQDPLEVQTPTLDVDDPSPLGVDAPTLGVDDPSPLGVDDPSPLGVEDPSPLGVAEQDPLEVQTPTLGVDDPSPLGVDAPTLGVDDPSPLGVEEPDPLPVETPVLPVEEVHPIPVDVPELSLEGSIDFSGEMGGGVPVLAPPGGGSGGGGIEGTPGESIRDHVLEPLFGETAANLERKASEWLRDVYPGFNSGGGSESGGSGGSNTLPYYEHYAEEQGGSGGDPEGMFGFSGSVGVDLELVEDEPARTDEEIRESRERARDAYGPDSTTTDELSTGSQSAPAQIEASPQVDITNEVRGLDRLNDSVGSLETTFEDLVDSIRDDLDDEADDLQGQIDDLERQIDDLERQITR